MRGEEDLGKGRNPFGGFLPSPNLSYPPNFPEPGFLHSAHQCMPYDAEQSTAQEMWGMNPGSGKFWGLERYGLDKEIGYRAGLAGGGRFAFIWMLGME